MDKLQKQVTLAKDPAAFAARQKQMEAAYSEHLADVIIARRKAERQTASPTKPKEKK